MSLSGLGYAGRSLRRSWGYAATVVLSLAFGIGGATTMYAIFYTILVRPLRYRHASRLVEVAEVHPERGPMAMRAAEYADWRAAVPAFERASGYLPGRFTISEPTRDFSVVGETTASLSCVEMRHYARQGISSLGSTVTSPRPFPTIETGRRNSRRTGTPCRS